MICKGLHRVPSIALAVALLFAPFKTKADTLIIAISDFSPFIVLSDESYGIHGEIIFSALDKVGQDFEVDIHSWSRVTEMLDKDEVCSFGWVKNKQRLDRWQYSRPYYADVSYFWARKDNPLQLEKIEDALNYRIGITRGYSYGQQIDELLHHAVTDESSDDEINIRKLLAGRIDLFPGSESMVKPILNGQFAEQADKIEKKIEISRLGHHFVCNKNSELGKRTIQKINQYLPAIE